MKMRTTAYLLFVAVLLLNPMVACNPLAPHYDYSAADLKQAVRGTWTVTTDKGHVATFTIDVGAATRHASRDFVAPAAACSHRSFVSSAEACADVSTMKLKVTVVSGETPTDATFMVVGTQFQRGELRMQIGGEYVSATVSPKGEVSDTLGAQVMHSL